MNNNFIEISPYDIKKNTFTCIGKDGCLITAKKDTKVNTMTASWGGLGVLWNKNVAYVVIRPQRYTKKFVDAADSFSIAFFEKEFKDILMYLGSVSGKDEDKISKSNLTTAYKDDVPYFAESELVLICKKLYATNLKETDFIDKDVAYKNYPDKDYHTLYIAEITKVLNKTNMV